MADPSLQLVPSYADHIPQPPSVQARVDYRERWKTGQRFGDLTGSQLAGILNKLEQGDIADWIDLCKYAIGTTEKLTSLYETTVARIVQADWVIVPNQYGNPQWSDMAADFVGQQLLRIRFFQKAMRDMLDALACGVSANEAVWCRDEVDDINYVEQFKHRHGHRFRYDDAWELRLYDRGSRKNAASRYGEQLWPHKWVVHQHETQAGYPNQGGIMRSCIWRWMFSRWVDKMWIGGVEKYGHPIAYVEVNPNTKESVRRQILRDLERLANDHVGVIEGHEIKMLEKATETYGAYKEYQDFVNARHTEAWLGSTDVTEPGPNGARGAVEVRASTTMDPRMVSWGAALSDTLNATLFRSLIELNAHKFPGIPCAQIPVPYLRMKTADDEVKKDPTAIAEENAAEQQAAHGEESFTSQVSRALSGEQAPGDEGGEDDLEAQLSALLAARKQKRDARVLQQQPDPKAQAPARTGRNGKTQPTSSRSRSPFVLALRGVLAGSVSSSRKRSATQPKR